MKKHRAEQNRQQLIERPKPQIKWPKHPELAPEIIAQRNAEIQKFIQVELDKQVGLARDQNNWAFKPQQWNHELMQNQVQQQSTTLELVEKKQILDKTEQCRWL